MILGRMDILAVFPEEEFLFVDGFDDAILGVDDRDRKVVYSVKKIFAILKTQGMTETEAMEYYEFNVLGSYVGEKTPIYLFDVFIREKDVPENTKLN
jgi:hypothetical protein